MLFDSDDRAAAEAIAELCYTNPFTARRIELERRALGPAFRDVQAVWNRSSLSFQNPNVEGLRQWARNLLHSARGRLDAGAAADPDELRIYAGLARYHLHECCGDELAPLVEGVVDASLSRGRRAAPAAERVEAYREFREQARHWYGVRDLFPGELARLPHLFATSVQVRLAFTLIYQSLLGSSPAAAALRAATWCSIFSVDMRRYERVMFAGMHEIPTLVLGPTGTGKELVARAIGLSAYVPFNGAAEHFAAPLGSDFHALNLSALSPTLIESELFGHRRGAFTGAVDDRVGHFEACSAHGAVFLDEVGDLDPAIQVKLLRVLQTRELQRVGDGETRSFAGRVLAATHRDLVASLDGGTFRHDLYYRLCAHTITTPSLREQLAHAPGDLAAFVEHCVQRVLSSGTNAGRPTQPSADTETLTADVVRFIEDHLGADYPWPGNVRELEQCVRSVLVQGDYNPVTGRGPVARTEETPIPIDLDAALAQTTLTADDLITRYCAAHYSRLRSYKEVADQLALDRRTVAARLGAVRGRAA